MASPSCASTLPWTAAFAPSSSSASAASPRGIQTRRAPSLVIVAQGKVKKYRQVSLSGLLSAFFSTDIRLYRLKELDD
jgi:large subunit ribosomal protein L9